MSRGNLRPPYITFWIRSTTYRDHHTQARDNDHPAELLPRDERRCPKLAGSEGKPAGRVARRKVARVSPLVKCWSYFPPAGVGATEVWRHTDEAARLSFSMFDMLRQRHRSFCCRPTQDLMAVPGACPAEHHQRTSGSAAGSGHATVSNQRRTRWPDAVSVAARRGRRQDCASTACSAHNDGSSVFCRGMRVRGALEKAG